MTVLTINMNFARLEITSSPGESIQVEGAALLTDGADGTVITERNPTNRPDALARVIVPIGSTVNVHSKSGDLRVFTFDGTLRARLDLGNARFDRVRGQFRVVSTLGTVVFDEALGRIDVLTTSANVEVRQLEGELQCVSDNGSFKFDAINGPLVARTTTGGITARDLAGISKLSTRSGEIRIRGVSRQLTVRSQSGDITLEGAIADHTTVETLKGRVEVRLGQGTDARIDAKAQQGLVRADRMAPGPGSGRRSLRTTVGSGRARLSVTTGKGVIEITPPPSARDSLLPIR